MTHAEALEHLGSLQGKIEAAMQMDVGPPQDGDIFGPTPQGVVKCKKCRAFGAKTDGCDEFRDYFGLSRSHLALTCQFTGSPPNEQERKVNEARVQPTANRVKAREDIVESECAAQY